MDITPLVPETAKVIQGYGNHRFKVGGESVAGHIIVLPAKILSWDVMAETLSFESLLPILAQEPVEILLVGTGRELFMPLPSFRQQCKNLGVAVDVMDTGAACRTYNVLLSEGRKVAAALVAVE